MPDGRFLSKSIAYSAQVGSVSLEADYLFMRMIPHLDSKGRMTGDPRSVKGLCCPLRDEITTQIVERCLHELATAGLVKWYMVDGNKHVELPGFAQHQRGARLDREAPSRIPEPTKGTTLIDSTPEKVRSKSGVAPEKVRVSKEKLSEVKVSKDPSSAAPTEGGNWVSRLAAVFRDKGGKVSEGHLGRDLKEAHVKYGEEILRSAIGLWLAERKAHGWSCAFPKFASDHVRWCEDAKALHEAVNSGVDYWDNEALQRITRPSLVA